MSIAEDSTATTDGEDTEVEVAVEVLVVGAGFAGLGMAVRLFEAGWRDLVIIEKAEDVGGTWRDNTYPGAACDVPSHLYSFSFAPNPEWSRAFSPQEEILAYLRGCADRYGVRPVIRFGHEMLGATWNAERGRWLVRTTRASFAARYLIAGMGPLADPSIPDVQGLENFKGVVWHSARWNHDESLEGRRVAVIGTGASTVQFLPEIAPVAERVVVLQRTPPWVMPRRDRAIRSWEKRIFRLVPGLQLAVRAGIYWGRELFFLGFKNGRTARSPMARAEKIARRLLDEQVADPALRQRLTPSYAIGCKRILLSNAYYPALTRENVEVVDGGLTAVSPHGVVDTEGREHEVDVIIFGTGFHATDPPIAGLLVGRDGALLSDVWAKGMEAYKGTCVTQFPNFFQLVGPNTGLGHNSIVYIIESQTEYIKQCLEAMRSAGQGVVEIRADAQERWNEMIQQKMAPTVWATGGCASWYLDGKGRNTTLWPGFSFQFRSAVRDFDADAYRMGPSPDEDTSVVPAAVPLMARPL